MQNEVPYYILDEEGKVEGFSSNAEAYIDDNDLKDLLLDICFHMCLAESLQSFLTLQPYGL